LRLPQAITKASVQEYQDSNQSLAIRSADQQRELDGEPR
jgi:hypothetical protein